MADISPALTLHSLEKAGAPKSATLSIKQWAEKNLASDSSDFASKIAKAKLHATAFGEGVRATGESVVFGALLGGVHGMLPQGLDFPIPGVRAHIPLDGVAALMGLVAGTFAAADPIGKTLAQGGATGAAIFSFRKVNDLLVTMRERKAGVTPGGGAASFPGRIGKATFTGEGGWADGSKSRLLNSDIGEDPVVTAARSV